MGGFSVSFFQDCIDIETIPCYGLLLSTRKHLFIHSFFIWLHYGCGLYRYTPFNIIYNMYLLYSHFFFFSQQVNHKVRCNNSNVIKKVQNLSQNQTIYIANIGFKSALGKWYCKYCKSNPDVILTGYLFLILQKLQFIPLLIGAITWLVQLNSCRIFVSAQLD